jgi:hypothetical protein
MMRVGEWAIMGATAVAMLIWVGICHAAQRRANQRENIQYLKEMGVLK